MSIRCAAVMTNAGLSLRFFECSGLIGWKDLCFRARFGRGLAAVRFLQGSGHGRRRWMCCIQSGRIRSSQRYPAAEPLAWDEVPSQVDRMTNLVDLVPEACCRHGFEAGLLSVISAY